MPGGVGDIGSDQRDAKPCIQSQPFDQSDTDEHHADYGSIRTGTTALTAVTGVGFNRQSVVYANGVAIPTVFTNSTTLTATMPQEGYLALGRSRLSLSGAVTTLPQTFMDLT